MIVILRVLLNLIIITFNYISISVNELSKFITITIKGKMKHGRSKKND